MCNFNDHITLKLNEVQIILSWFAEVNKKGEGVDVFGKMLTPVPILGEPDDICSSTSANRTDIIIAIIIRNPHPPTPTNTHLITV